MEQVLGVFGVIGDFGGKVVSLSKYLAGQVDNLFSVVVVLGEDERLRNDGAAREDFSKQPVTEGFEDKTDLGSAGDFAVELGFGVFEVFFQFFEPLLSGHLVLFGDNGSCLDCRAFVRNLGLDAVHLEIDVHSISNRLRIRVFGNKVLLEKADGLFGGCSRQT